MNYGTAMPHHQTLISIAKPYGYRSNFFCGGNPNFDNLDLFLEYQKTDHFVETSFPKSIKQKANISSWGLADRDVFRYATTVLGEGRRRDLIFYLTLSTHGHFVCPDTTIAAQANARMNTPASATKTLMLENRNIFQCLRYTDHAIRGSLYKHTPNVPILMKPYLSSREITD